MYLADRLEYNKTFLFSILFFVIMHECYILNSGVLPALRRSTESIKSGCGIYQLIVVKCFKAMHNEFKFFVKMLDLEQLPSI